MIPVAGHGKRLARLTRHVSKELLPLGDSVVMSHILAELQEAGVRDVVLVSRQDKPDIATYVDKVTSERLFDLHIRVLHQGDVPGNGGAILTAASAIGAQPFIVIWGDEVFQGRSRVGQLIAAYETLAAPCICVVQVSDADVSKCGIAEGPTTDRGHLRVSRILEKPSPTATLSRWASVGGFVLEPHVVDVLTALRPGADGEVYLSTALDIVARRGPLFGVPIDGRWFETGSYEGYARATAAFAGNRGAPG